MNIKKALLSVNRSFLYCHIKMVVVIYHDRLIWYLLRFSVDCHSLLMDIKKNCFQLISILVRWILCYKSQILNKFSNLCPMGILKITWKMWILFQSKTMQLCWAKMFRLLKNGYEKISYCNNFRQIIFMQTYECLFI